MMQATKSSIMSDDEIDDSNSSIIRGGRGVTNYNHSGNKKFRDMVEVHLNAYETSKKVKKTELINKVTKQILEDEGMQFIRRKEDEWVPLTEEEIRNKVAHRFRDALDARERAKRLEPEGIPGTERNPLKIDDLNDTVQRGRQRHMPTIQETLCALQRALGVPFRPSMEPNAVPSSQGRGTNPMPHSNFFRNGNHQLAAPAMRRGPYMSNGQVLRQPDMEQNSMIAQSLQKNVPLIEPPFVVAQSGHMHNNAQVVLPPIMSQRNRIHQLTRQLHENNETPMGRPGLAAPQERGASTMPHHGDFFSAHQEQLAQQGARHNSYMRPNAAHMMVPAVMEQTNGVHHDFTEQELQKQEEEALKTFAAANFLRRARRNNQAMSAAPLPNDSPLFGGTHYPLFPNFHQYSVPNMFEASRFQPPGGGPPAIGTNESMVNIMREVEVICEVKSADGIVPPSATSSSNMG